MVSVAIQKASWGSSNDASDVKLYNKGKGTYSTEPYNRGGI